MELGLQGLHTCGRNELHRNELPGKTSSFLVPGAGLTWVEQSETKGRKGLRLPQENSKGVEAVWKRTGEQWLSGARDFKAGHGYGEQETENEKQS